MSGRQTIAGWAKVRIPRSLPTIESNGYQTFSQKDIGLIKSPCVYLFIKDGVALYIGSSKNGLERVIHGSHHRADVREQADKIEVIWCKKEQHARDLELQMIRKLQPRFNRRRQGSVGQSSEQQEYFGA